MFKFILCPNYLKTSSLDLLVNKMPHCPLSLLDISWTFSLHSSSLDLPRATEMTRFFPKKNLWDIKRKLVILGEIIRIKNYFLPAVFPFISDGFQLVISHILNWEKIDVGIFLNTRSYIFNELLFATQTFLFCLGKRN